MAVGLGGGRCGPEVTQGGFDVGIFELEGFVGDLFIVEGESEKIDKKRVGELVMRIVFKFIVSVE